MYQARLTPSEKKDRHGTGQRGRDADGAHPVVIDALGHDVNLERALVILVADERRDDDSPRLAIRIAIGNVNCSGRRASRLLVDDWPSDPRQTGAGDLNSSIARKGPVALGRWLSASANL